MKYLPALLLLLLAGRLSLAQTHSPVCNCPSSQDLAHQGAPDRVFHFSNGRQIGLCGDVDIQGKDTIYSEAILYHCDAEGFFRAWDGKQTCKVIQRRDTVLAQPLFDLPIGKNMSIVTTVFTTEKLFYRGAAFIDTIVYRTDLPKYSATQVKEVLAQYAKLTRGNEDNIMPVARRLFWACVSGSAEADKALHQMEEQLGPFTKRADEFEEIHGAYWAWKYKRGMSWLTE